MCSIVLADGLKLKGREVCLGGFGVSDGYVGVGHEGVHVDIIQIVVFGCSFLSTQGGSVDCDGLD
ncbi:hypothetical protein ATY41_03950 [Leifsonia xyli subsp. xyli]|uniref:Uncharacterized protein n=1 Tax=Leifsonia xyli subsp. xyli TaxID=59736 RepID=A0A1E2SJH2_LEIXY|nr:hypothetical protein ATY41_03950 [Leifsonia xyli subsp. xyli]